MTAGGLGDRELIAAWQTITEGFTRTNRVLLDDVERRGLPSSWFELMLLLLRTPGHRMAMTPLSIELDITSGGLTKLVDKLERAGLTERQSDKIDRRLVYTALTEAGERTVREALVHHAALLRSVVEAELGPAELESLRHSMRSLRDARRRQRPQRRG